MIYLSFCHERNDLPLIPSALCFVYCFICDYYVPEFQEISVFLTLILVLNSFEFDHEFHGELHTNQQYVSLHK